MRLMVLAVLCVSLGSFSAADPARAAMKEQTDIPAQGLGPALRTLAKERGFQVVFRTEVVGLARTHGAHGTLSTSEALTQLLEDTRLSYTYLDDNTVTIVPLTRSLPAGEPDRGSDFERSDSAGSYLRLAQAGTQVPSMGAGGNGEKSAEVTGIQEIVVTAQKRTERLQDVPVPVTVLDSQTLANSGQVLLRDYYATVPGLNVTPNYAAQQDLSIRGITTGGFTAPTVGVLVDDIPFTGATLFTQGDEVPDMDPGDLARIEVLRGPQGTLYGANSMGGLLKFVTVDPSTDAVHGRIETGTSTVQNGAEPGFNLRGSLNLPLSNDFAVRISGFRRQDAGYIDNPTLHQDGVNEAIAYGGRLAALWKPMDDLTIKVSGLYQNVRSTGTSDVIVAPGLRDLQQNFVTPGAGGSTKTVEAFSTTINYFLGPAQLTSITGYNINRYDNSLDDTPSLGGAIAFVFKGDAAAAPYYAGGSAKKFTQELRLSTPLGAQVNWMLGGFYTHESGPNYFAVNAMVPITGEVRGQAVYSYYPATYGEEAAFTDLTFRLTDRFDIQLGGRATHIDVTDKTATYTGPFVGFLYPGQASPYSTPAASTTSNPLTYLLTPRFKFSQDLMLYARFASGFRPGGTNSGEPGAPLTYGPDKTMNYELGLKGDFLDHLLSIDGSIYYIDWKGIQIQLRNGAGFVYLANGGQAKSEGVELAFNLRPARGLGISAWFSYDDAVLTESLASSSTAVGADGDRLPNSSKYSANLSVNEEMPVPITENSVAFVGGQMSYVGDRLGQFQGTPVRQNYPGYVRTDLRSGLKWNSWTANLFVNNVTNRRGVLEGGIGYIYSNGFVYIQPRTIGVSLTKEF